MWFTKERHYNSKHHMRLHFCSNVRTTKRTPSLQRDRISFQRNTSLPLAKSKGIPRILRLRQLHPRHWLRKWEVFTCQSERLHDRMWPEWRTLKSLSWTIIQRLSMWLSGGSLYRCLSRRLHQYSSSSPFVYTRTSKTCNRGNGEDT